MKKKMFIDTERLIIRPFENEDFNQWNEGFNNRLPSQYKYDDGLSEDSSTFTKEWFNDWIQGFNAAAEKDEMYILGVFRKEDGVNVGKVELSTIRRMNYDWAMMGYSIHNQYFRQGYGKESVLAASELFFNELNINRIELHINVDNEPSKSLALSTDFRYECTREAFSYEGGKWTDFLIYYKNRVHKEDESKKG